MGIRGRGLVLAMEEDEIVTDAANGTSAAELEAGVSEVVSDAAEVEEMVTAVEEAVEDTETLGEIQEVMQDGVDSGAGVSEDAARVAEIAVEAICRRLGVQDKVMPASESFGEATTRLASTRIATEGFVEIVKKVWESIKKTFVSIKTKILDFFKRFFANADKLKAEADKVRDKVNNLTNKKIKNAEYDDKGTANAFKKFDGSHSKAIVTEVLKNHQSILNSASAVIPKIGNFGNELSVTLIKPDNADVSKFQQTVIDLAKKIQDGVSSSRKVNDSTSNKDETDQFGPYVDGGYLEVTTRQEDGQARISLSTNTGKDASSTKVSTLSKSEMLDICENVKTIAKLTEAYKNKQKDIEGTLNTYVKLADAAITNANKIADAAENNNETKKAIKAIQMLTTDLNALASRCSTMLPAFSVSAGNKALRYVKNSIDQYEDNK